MVWFPPCVWTGHNRTKWNRIKWNRIEKKIKTKETLTEQNGTEHIGPDLIFLVVPWTYTIYYTIYTINLKSRERARTQGYLCSTETKLHRHQSIWHLLTPDTEATVWHTLQHWHTPTHTWVCCFSLNLLSKPAAVHICDRATLLKPVRKRWEGDGRGLPCHRVYLIIE